MLPNILSFDPENKVQFVHPACKAPALNIASLLCRIPLCPTSTWSHPWSYCRHLPIFFSLQACLRAHSSYYSESTSSPNNTCSLCIRVIHLISRSVTLSAHVVSQICKTELHIVNVTAYERLAVQHIVPDILVEIDDKTLIAEIGILMRDIICVPIGLA